MNFENDHLEAQQALPWLANGTLEGTELARMEHHVQVCASCREELALLHTLHAAGPGPAPQADMEAALARLLPQLEAQPVLMAAPAPAVLAKTLRQRLAANDRSWLRTGVFLQCCVIAVLGFQLMRPAGVQPDTYHALGAGAGAGGAAASSLVVAFNPDTTERELRRIVLASGARVVGGPTATGAWMLATEQSAASVLARLRAEPAVLLAQPLGVEGRP